MNDLNDDLAVWRADWQREDSARDTSVPIVVWARRRRPMLVAWVAGESIIALAGFAIVGYLFVTAADTVERLAMGGLTLMCAAAALFSWWNWRGAVRASAETTLVYLDLTARRLSAMRRGVIAGWIILSVELMLLTPWVWYRVVTRPAVESLPARGWPWALLVTMTALGVVALLQMGRWVKRETAIVERLRREMDDADR